MRIISPVYAITHAHVDAPTATYLAGEGIASHQPSPGSPNRPTLTWELSSVAVKFSRNLDLIIRASLASQPRNMRVREPG